MKSEEFIGLLGGIDSKMIEKASEDIFNWQKSQEGEPIIVDAPRKASLWLPIASVVCAAAAVIGGFFIIRNIRQNRSFGIAGDPNSSSVLSGGSENRVPVSTEISESSPVQGDESLDGDPVIDRDPTRLSYDDMKFEAVDPVDDRIIYYCEFNPDRITYTIKYLSSDKISMGNDGQFVFNDDQSFFEDSDISRQYMYEFFGNDRSMVSGPYSYSDWQRWADDGHFELNVVDGTSAHVYAPVGGRVITVEDSQARYGKTVAVEIPGEKIFVIYHLDKVLVNVGDVVSECQPLGVRDETYGDVYNVKPDLRMVLMKKKTDPPYLVRTVEVDGVTLVLSVNKEIYEIGEPIHLTAAVENNTGMDIYLSYGGSSFHLNPHIEDLVEYPHRVSGVMDDIAGYYLLTQGEKVVQDFTFQTYTGYYWNKMDTTNYDGTTRIYPDPDKPAESGTYFGELAVTVYFDYPDIGADVEVKTYTLDFEIDIRGEDAEEVAAENTAHNYTDQMLRDFFIYNGVLYTNCYKCNIDWATAAFEELEPGKVGELVAIIDNRADLHRFKNNTANWLPKGSKIYEFPGNRELLIAKWSDIDLYIPYMAMREG